MGAKIESARKTFQTGLQQDNPKLVKRALKKFPALAQECDPKGRRPPIHFAIRNRNYDAAKALAAYTGSELLTSPRGYSQTPLGDAMDIGNEDLACAIIQYIDAQDLLKINPFGTSFLYEAATRGLQKTALAIAHKNPKTLQVLNPANNNNPIEAARSHGYHDLAEALAKINN